MPTRGVGRPVAVGLLVLLSFCLPACQPPADRPASAPAATSQLVLRREPRDVLLITIDTLRHDATGFSGSGNVETPNLDRLADGGVIFSWTHAHAVITLPSHASILTGLHPYEHGIRDNAGFVLPPGTTTLATLLRARHYATAAFVSAAPLDRRFGLDAGFDVYDDEYEGRSAGAFLVPERPDVETVARAKAWWDANAGRQRFAWVHLFGPHHPYAPAEPFASRYAGRPYYGDVAQTDAVLDRLLQPLLDGQDAPTLVVLTSDHGEALGEHDEEGHGLFAYETTLRVPLVVWSRGMLAPGVDRRSAVHVDLVPTILDLLGLEIPQGLPGKALFSANDAGADDGCYFEALSASFNRGWSPLYGRLEGRTKAIRLPIPELYDLEQDAQEAVNLAQSRPATLDDILSRLPPETTGPIERGAVDEEVAARLRSLGYVATSAGATREVNRDPAKDPKNLVGVQRSLHEAGTRYAVGDVEGAVAVLEDLVTRHPEMTVAYSYLGRLYLDGNRVEDAVALLERAAASGVQDESLRVLLARALRRSGAARRGWDVLADDRGSARPDTQYVLARLASDLGRTAEARERYQLALQGDPSFPGPRLELGLLEVREQRFAEAIPHLERALAVLADHGKGWNALGVARAETGDLQRAIAAWERARRSDPTDPNPLLNLALALARSGSDEQAIRKLEIYLQLVDGQRRRRAERLLESLRRGDGP